MHASLFAHTECVIRVAIRRVRNTPGFNAAVSAVQARVIAHAPVFLPDANSPTYAVGHRTRPSDLSIHHQAEPAR